MIDSCIEIFTYKGKTYFFNLYSPNLARKILKRLQKQKLIKNVITLNRNKYWAKSEFTIMWMNN